MKKIKDFVLYWAMFLVCLTFLAGLWLDAFVWFKENEEDL